MDIRTENGTFGVLNNTERILFAMRSLLKRYGYRAYRMGKFEEYDLYSRNKDFLISDGVITFTDTGGRLMALKPDVTLSIIKNNEDRPEAVRKLYYNENVYRVSKSVNSFKEIMQAGLECIGLVDEFCIGEVLLLAAKSLELISPGFVLEITDLDILTALLSRMTEDASVRREILRCFGEKNAHELAGTCEEAGIKKEDLELLLKLNGLSGPAETVLPVLSSLPLGDEGAEAAAELSRILGIFRGTGLEPHIQLDFSAVSDTKYYNGIVFKGFIEGVPERVLSGGQYDRLMQRMGKRSKAIGFAVYLDLLERLGKKQDAPDFDVLLTYGEDADPERLRAAADSLRSLGLSVCTEREPDGDIKYAKKAQFRNNEVRFIENA